MVEAFKEALSGMTFQAFDETFGELVVDRVEKVLLMLEIYYCMIMKMLLMILWKIMLSL